MILTRTYLNASRRGARKLLGSPQAMHAAILSGFPPDREPGRVLWRVDNAGAPKPTVYIVSRVQPDLTHLDEQAGWPSTPSATSVDYQSFLDRLTSGQTWGFRITVNPTHRVKRQGRSQIMAHVTAAQQEQWFVDRSSSMGACLSVPDDEGKAQPTFGLVDRGTRTFRRGSATVTLGVATFTGRLRVTDPDSLRDVLINGLGRAKAYGCGLLTLAAP